MWVTSLVIDASDGARHQDIGKLLNGLATISYGPGKLTSAKPWTVVATGSERSVTQLKRLMVDRNIDFNDGYELLRFNPVTFERMPVINTRQRSKTIELSSYSIRIISFENYQRHSKQLKRPDSVINLTNSSVVETRDTIYLTNIPFKRIMEILGA